MEQDGTMQEEYNAGLKNIEQSMHDVNESMQHLAQLVETQKEPLNLVNNHQQAQKEAKEALDQIAEVYDQRSWCTLV